MRRSSFFFEFGKLLSFCSNPFVNCVIVPIEYIGGFCFVFI